MALNLATDTGTWKGMEEQLAMRPYQFFFNIPHDVRHTQAC